MTGAARLQALVGVGVLALAVVLAAGAVGIPSEAGYGGVGPNFLPWLVAGALALCGSSLLWEARSGGFRQLEPPSGARRGDWRAFAWVSAGLLANALLITWAGFILSCALCFVLAARGLRVSEDQSAPLASVGRDALVGLAIAAPVYWAFTKLLGINLPGLTATGWL
ncbi:MAG: tripartite tricarboxylate transporter TctB [Ramlibacter sp.]|jgi:putative tricarboxylic transport membrane protein|uniref:tripartite tricarboxylate transporter TctB family protein n=1 Tax=Ramlibacter sp. TaxID=1917967 RepID=UPI002638DB7E|nr:tripartite tricarboxylate transporter TctB family protein [Ramlibacter sp.]MDB5752490.1 tripartite tricarboxylate transporter TctB [Ramlibacter sp.]